MKWNFRKTASALVGVLILMSIWHSLHNIQSLHVEEPLGIFFSFLVLLNGYFFLGTKNFLIAQGYCLDKIKPQLLVFTIAFMLLMILPIIFGEKPIDDDRKALAIAAIEILKTICIEFIFKFLFFFFWELPRKGKQG